MSNYDPVARISTQLPASLHIRSLSVELMPNLIYVNLLRRATSGNFGQANWLGFVL
jgi:hypothetical protein